MEATVGRLSEHESALAGTLSTDPLGYTPTPEEKKAVKLVEKLFEKAKKHREKYDSKWTDYYKMFRGKHWKEERPSYRHSAVINLVFRVIQSQVPIMTDARPKIEFLPQEPSDRELAAILNEVADSDWEKYNWLMQLVEIVYDANIYGIGYGGVEYDAKEGYPNGKICFESKDPFYSFPAPYARAINHKSSPHFIEAEPVPLDQLKAEYPDKAKLLKADLVDFMDGDKTDIHGSKYRSTTDSAIILEGSRENSSLTDNDRALKITCWIKDEEVVEEKKDKGTDEQGQPITETIIRKKYPRGRKIVVSNKVLLEDRENEYEDGKIPRSKYVNYMLPREFYGISEIEQIEGPQLTYNKIFSFVLDVLTLMGNPIWIVSNDSGIDTDNLYNRPGMVLEPNPNARVDRVEGVQLQPYVINLLERVGEAINDLAGSSDVSRGIKPEGVTAAKAIQALQESGQTRLRQKSRFLDAFLQDVGQQYLSRVLQFRTVPQVYRLTNNENVTKYFKFHVETGEDGKKVARYRELMTLENGQTAYSDEKVFAIQGEFDVKVGTGSSLPFATAEKEQRAYALYDRGIIDEEEVLKTVDWPNKEAVLERVRAKKEQEMMAQQSAGQPA